MLLLHITMKVYTFIGRLIRHIPDKYFPMIRYDGQVVKFDPQNLDPKTEVIRF